MKKRSVTIIALLVGLLTLDLIVSLGPPKERVNQYINDSMAMAAKTYVVCSIVNGIVSTIKESSVSASPGGVGVEIEVGQVLDPVDDAVERIAGLASTSLAVSGVQKIVFNIITEKITWVFILFSILTLVLYLVFPEAKFNSALLRIFFVVLFVRLSIPVMCGVGIWIDDEYIQKGIDANLASLKELVPGSEVENVEKDLAPKQEERSWYEKLGDYVESAKKQVVDFYITLKQISGNLFQIMDNFKEIIILLAAKIVLQMLLIPLGALWVMRRLFGLIFEGELVFSRIIEKRISE